MAGTRNPRSSSISDYAMALAIRRARLDGKVLDTEERARTYIGAKTAYACRHEVPATIKLKGYTHPTDFSHYSNVVTESEVNIYGVPEVTIMI